MKIRLSGKRETVNAVKKFYPGTGLSDEGVLRSKSDIARSTRKSKTSALVEATREKRSAA